MQSSLLLIRPAPDKRALRRSLRKKPLSALVGEEASGTRVYLAWLPGSSDAGTRLTRRVWRRIDQLAQEWGILFALAPGMDRRDISAHLYVRGITLLDPEGVRQYLTLVAVERWLSLLGRETAAEMHACVEDADSRWGPLWVRLLSGWVRYVTVSGRGERLEKLQREMLVRDGTVLAIGGQGSADIRVLLGNAGAYGDERILVDARPACGERIPDALRYGWPAVPEPEPRDMLSLEERILIGLYHALGHRFFSACVPSVGIANKREPGALLAKAGIQVKGFLTDTTGITFDRMRYQFLDDWSQTMADRRKSRLDNCEGLDI